MRGSGRAVRSIISFTSSCQRRSAYYLLGEKTAARPVPLAGSSHYRLACSPGFMIINAQYEANLTECFSGKYRLDINEPINILKGSLVHGNLA